MLGAKVRCHHAALVPGQTKSQCYMRWKDVLDPSIVRVSGRKGAWTSDKKSKLEDAVQRYGGKNSGAITALIPGQVGSQCRHRWKEVLDPSIERANGCNSPFHTAL
jgi:uncharacterized protein (DUF2237 family)